MGNQSFSHLYFLGFNEQLAHNAHKVGLHDETIARVITEHKERYIIHDGHTTLEAELLGNFRYSAHTREDLPAVGDWVACKIFDQNKALIHAVLPRESILQRKKVGKQTGTQIIATNVDVGFIVMAVDQDFNINRLERYVTICKFSGIKPIIILSKIDLISEDTLVDQKNRITERLTEVRIYCISNASQSGIEALKAFIHSGKTYCLLGSSGVGKSTLINTIMGSERMIVSAISAYNAKGRHTTTHRELLILPDGGILIDNPGMREVGMTGEESEEAGFDLIAELAELCKFKDCTHIQEAGCAVLKALETGELDQKQYENFQKIQRENQHYQSSIAEKRRKDRAQGKLYKRIQQAKKSRKY